MQTYERSGRRWVVGGIRWLDGRGTPRGDVAAPPSWITMPMLASLGWCCIPHQATYVNSEMFHELGGFRKELKYAGDYELFLRALAIEPFARIGRTLACFRRHGDNQSMSITPEHRAESDALEAPVPPVPPLPGVEEAILSLFIEILAQRHEPLMVRVQAYRCTPGPASPADVPGIGGAKS